MSNLIEKGKYPIDMTEKEVRDLENFIENGMPGLYEISAEKISRMIQLYFDGNSYHDIALKLGMKKNIILFIAHKHNFYQDKIEKYENLAKSIVEKADLTQNRGVDLLLDTMASLELYYREILRRYIMTRDPRVIESADFENFKMYMKCMETLQKIKNPENNGGKTPSMGLNLPNGGILKKIDDNTVEVSPLNSKKENESKLSEVLKTLAELREKRENK